MFCRTDTRNIFYDEFPGNSSAGQEKCITVYIEEDQIVEDPEIRVFTLAVVNGNDLLGDIVTHNVTEIDNDGKKCNYVFVQLLISVSES